MTPTGLLPKFVRNPTPTTYRLVPNRSPYTHSDSPRGVGGDDRWLDNLHDLLLQPTKAGALCRKLRLAGIAKSNLGHPAIRMLLDAGAHEDEFLGTGAYRSVRTTASTTLAL